VSLFANPHPQALVCDLFGKVICSSQPAGQVAQDVNGKISCAGGCEQGITDGGVLHSLVRVLTIASLCVAALSAALAQATAANTASRFPALAAPQSQALTPGHLPAPDASPVGPVKIGVYLYSVQELDFSKQTFHPTFEVWFRWRGDSFDPLANFHIDGARSMTVALEDRRKLANNENYAVARVDAVINQAFDASAFPFDRHRLQIAIESPYEDDYLVYEMDRDASMLDPNVFSPVWRLSGFQLREYRKKYPTSFGLPERTEDGYSTLVVEVVAERISSRVVVDYFIGFMVCVLLCLFGYFVPASPLQVRTTLATSATFAAVGNKYIVNSLTATSVAAPLVNVAVITSFAILLIYISVSIRCARLIEAGERARAARLNRTIGIGSAVGYGALMAFFFWRALTAIPT